MTNEPKLLGNPLAKLLVRERLDLFEPLGAFGQPVYQASLALKSAISKRLGKKYADYFADVEVNPKNNDIAYYASSDGEVKAWKDMSPEDSARHALTLANMREKFVQFGMELAGPEAQGGNATLAGILSQALMVPDDEKLFFVGDQPVIAFWGFRKKSESPVDPLTFVPKPLVATAPMAAAVAAAPVVAATPWWRWLLLALLLLLLLLTLYACWPETKVVIPIDANLPTMSPENLPEGAVIKEIDGRRVIVDADGQIIGTVAETSLDGTNLPKVDAEKMDKELGENPIVPEDATKEDLKKQEPKPDELKNDDPKKDEPKPEDQKLDEPKKDEAQKDDPTKKDQPDPAAKPLEIPKGADQSGSVKFIEGNWQSKDSLTDNATNQKLQQSYRFDDQGNGEVILKREDGTVCKAPAKATMNGGKLTIDEQSDIVCADGSKIAKAKTECVKNASGTACTGIAQDGSKYEVEMNKAP